MAFLIAKGIFSIAQLCALNRFRKFKKVHSIAEFLLCDGMTVDPAILTGTPGWSSRRFSREKPTKADLELWKSAIQTIY